MNPKHIAGVSGAVGLAVIGLIGVRYQGGNGRARRAVPEEAVELETDYELEVDGFIEDPNFVDEWLDESENATASWMAFNADLGVTLEEEDVTEKARKKRKKKLNWAKLKESSLPDLDEKMKTEYAAREEKLKFFNQISGVAYGRVNEIDDMGDYLGYGKTAPVINQFLDAFNCQGNGKGLWRSGGKTNIWALFPQSVPLFTGADDHITDWGYYWKFFMKIAAGWPTNSRDLRFSMGTYGSSASFTPRGYKYRKNVPWSRMQRYYKKPKMQASQPRFFNTLRSTLTYLPRYGVSTATAGDNCVLFWFFQDIPSDIEDFMIPEEFAMVEELHSVCTLIPIVVGPNSNSNEWRNFMANVIPGLRTKYSKDPDYTGAFHVSSLKELMDPALLEHVNNFQCLVENRATCRTVENAYIPVASESPTAEATMNLRGIEEDYDPTAAAAAEAVAEATDAPGTEGTAGTEGVATTQKVPEIDSCCGHDGFSGTPFDSELKTCCEDGQVRAYEFEGDDPCLSAEFFK